jgi:hypothetical protein
MQRYVQLVVLVGVALLVSSCSDTDARLAQPSFARASSAVVKPMSSTAIARPVSDAFCPSVSPFNVQFGIIVTANGTVVIVNAIRFQFIDTSGLQTPQVTLPMPPVTFAAPNPVPPFGSTMVQPGSAITVPLTLGIGCGTGTTGTIIIIVVTSDDQGRTQSQQVSVAVR